MDKISVMLTPEEIQTKVAEIGKIISKDYEGKKITAISVLNGAFVFTADLLRCLDLDVELRFIRAKSYLGTNTSGDVKIAETEEIDVKDKHVLIIEDIIDSGLTLQKLKEKFSNLGCASVKMVTFLDKPSRRKVDVTPDYCCYQIEDKFVVGYGLDYDEKYRQLPFVGIVTPDAN